MAEFEPAVEIVLKHEGGYVNNPADPGGETNMGITKRSYPSEDIAGMTVERAKEIYFRDYWLAGRYGELVDQAVATKVFDCAVTMQRFGGHGPAILILQDAIIACGGVVDLDSTTGPQTIAEANAIEGPMLLGAIKIAAVEHYREIVANYPSELQFLRGWEIRAES